MKNCIIATLFLLLSLASNAQTDYYRYNNSGVPEKVGYSTPSNTNNFSSYVPRYDVNVYREVLRTKQAAYERNLSEVHDLVDDIEHSMKYLRRVNSAVADQYTTQINAYLKQINRADYSNFQTASSIKRTLKRYLIAIDEATDGYSSN